MEKALLERTDELAELRDLVHRTASPCGALVLLEGEPGIGKTTLLEACREMAEQAGLQVLTARGGELERELPFGVARQLLEPVLLRSDDHERESLLAGSAGLARGVLMPAAPGTADYYQTDPAAALHGLYWVVVNLAERGPVLLAVDDMHWADAASVRFLGYLARRLEELPALVVAALRPAEPGADHGLLDRALRTDVELLHPRPLSETATAELVRRELDPQAHPEFSKACHEVSGGNPFLVRELLVTARQAGMRGTAQAASDVTEMGPRAVARSILVRVGRIGSDAVAVARAVALLAHDADLRHVVALTGLDDAAAARAADALVAAQIVELERPLRFRHPLMRAAVYGELGHAGRSREHRRVAELLAAEGEEPERVATHLLAVEPMGDGWIVARLREAAMRALEVGAPDAAADYLRRALEEPPAAGVRADVLFALGSASFGLSPAAAVDPLREALAASVEDGQRTAITLTLAKALMLSDRPREAVELLEEAGPDGAAADGSPALQLEAELLRWSLWWADDNRRREHSERLRRAAARVDGETLWERHVLALRGWSLVLGGDGDAGQAIELAERACQVAGPEGDITSGIASFTEMAGMVFLFCDALARADDIFARSIDDNRRLGRLAYLPFAYAQHAHTLLRSGRLAEAETQARTGWELAGQHGPALPAWWYSVGSLLQVFAVRGALEEASELIEAQRLGEALPEAVVFPMPTEVRGQVRILRGELEAGVEDLLAAGRWFEQRGWVNPTRSTWSTAVTPALAMLGRTDEALGIARGTLERARAFGAPWALGRALRAAGLVDGGERGLALLHESVAILGQSSVRGEYAQSLVELGAALRRAKHRSEAREQLRLGLDLATRCGALALAERAAEELVIAGARPRRAALTGVEALTASEQRVADLAAQGMTNREVAQQLFVTPKTVERHLTHIYQKLRIASREQLAEALQRPAR